jgi:diaminopimelate epimerase
MYRLPFIKAHGAGNDFILIDNRRCDFPFEDGSLIGHLCHRRFGIGADGLILLQHSEKADYRMVYFNADGKEANLCGNGLRCFVAFICELGDHRASLTIETKSGLIECKRNGQRITSCFPEPQILRGPFPLALSGGVRETFHVFSGVPHAVIFSDELEEEDLQLLGREVRNHPAFLPAGVNVNLIEWEETVVRIRTYERGVEAETFACGTAALAAAKVVSTLRKLERVAIYPRSQELLEVNTESWELTGSAQLVYEGTMCI